MVSPPVMSWWKFFMGKTLYGKTWDAHTVGQMVDGRTQLFIGSHLIHEVTSPQAFGMIRDLGLGVKFPERTFATVDHIVPTQSQVQPFEDPLAEAMINELKKNVEEYGIKYFAKLLHRATASSHSSSFGE